MNSTTIHPAFASDYARSRAVEAARNAENIRRARAFRSDAVPSPEPTRPAAVPAGRRQRRRWPGFRAGATAG